jgi:flavodoxin
MKVEILHASKFGNGAMVAQEVRRLMESKGNQANVHHIDESKPKELPIAELYIFGSPTRYGGPIGSMHRFIKRIALPPGTKYAIFATHGDAVPDKKTGRMPTADEIERSRKTIPILDEVLKGKGLVKVAGWQKQVETFVGRILGPS